MCLPSVRALVTQGITLVRSARHRGPYRLHPDLLLDPVLGLVFFRRARECNSLFAFCHGATPAGCPSGSATRLSYWPRVARPLLVNSCRAATSTRCLL